MLGKAISNSINVITLPSRMILRAAGSTLARTKNLGHELQAMSLDFQQAREEAEFLMQAIMTKVDAEIGRDVQDMTWAERQVAANRELANAEQQLSAALMSMLKVFRLITPETGRVIEHGPVTRLS